MSNCVQQIEMTDDDIMIIYRWFQSAMRRAGRNIKMPLGTDPTKTYQYRWVRKFADRSVNEWHLDMKTTKLLVESLVAYGKRNNLLNQGAGLLNMNVAVDLCVQTLETSIHKSSTIVSMLSGSKAYLERHALTTPEKLASARKTGSYSNLLCLFESGTLSLEYLALSNNCNKALALIGMERSSLPSERELFHVRARLLLDKEINRQIVNTMGSDLLSARLLEITQ